MIGRPQDRMIGGAACVMVIGIVSLMVLQNDHHERALLASGDCKAVTGALYTPPPSAHTSCFGDAESRSCNTWYSQPDPYFRTLWRCTDPDRGGKLVEFWRRSTDEAAP